MSLTVMFSPIHRVGVSTIGNYLANEMAKDDLTLYIEWSDSTGKSVYINNSITERKRCLSNAVYSTSELKNNLIRSKHNKNLFYLCQNINNTVLSLKNYSKTSLYRIVKEAEADFKHIIIDLPADLREQVVTYTFSRHFHHIDNIIVVLDEDAITFKKLHDFSAVLSFGHEDAKEVTYIVNKTTQYYVDFIDKALELPKLKPLNLLKIEDFKEMSDRTNRGNLYGLTGGRKYRKFFKEINKLADICLNNKDGYGIKPIYVSEATKERRLGSKYVPPKQHKPLFGKKNNKAMEQDIQVNDMVSSSEEVLFESLDEISNSTIKPQVDVTQTKSESKPMIQQESEQAVPVQSSINPESEIQPQVDTQVAQGTQMESTQTTDEVESVKIDLLEPDISEQKQSGDKSTPKKRGLFGFKKDKPNRIPKTNSHKIDLDNLEPTIEAGEDNNE